MGDELNGDLQAIKDAGRKVHEEINKQSDRIDALEAKADKAIKKVVIEAEKVEVRQVIQDERLDNLENED